MNEVPPGWESAKLRDIVELRTGPFGSSLHQSDYVDGGIPIVNPMHIEEGRIQPSQKHRVSDKTAERLSEFRLRVGDVILGRRGEMGRCAVVRANQVGWLCGTGSLIVRPRQGIASDFLQGLLSSDAVVKHLAAESVGTTMVNLNQRILLDLDIVIPPREEQIRIVEKLEELLSDLDAGVTELKAAQRKLAQYRQSLLKAAVEGALTADWRGNVPAPGELPEGWKWTTIGALGKAQLGRQRSPDKLKGVNPTKYIRAANITEDGIDFDDVLEMDFSETERGNFALRANDVLLTEASGSAEHVGRPVIWPAVTGLYCFQNTVLRFIPNGISAEFAFYSFLAMQKTGVFRRLSAGVGINHLSAGKFSKLPLALPPEEEQRQIITILKAQLEAVKEQQAAIERGVAQAAAQRKNLLKAAFSGQLTPQDPNDEPASELLARIRAERASSGGDVPRRRRKTA